MEPFTAAAHDQVLLLVVQIAVLLFTARILGELSRRLGQPSVVGEIAAGILLGPSFLSSAFPVVGRWIVPTSDVSGYLLETISLLGAMFLLLITGLETDIALIRRHARTAMGVSLFGIALTFTAGFLLGHNLPAFLLGPVGDRNVFALFLGTAMAISAIPVIAKVLLDLNLMRRDVGQTIIAAGMSDDTIGWILLSVVAGLATGKAVTVGNVLPIVLMVLAFMIGSFTIGRAITKKLIDLVQDHFTSGYGFISLVVVLMFAWGAITQAMHFEAVLGAFVAGIVFGQMRRLPVEIHHTLQTIALGIFAPIFFAVAGLKVNLLRLLEPQLLEVAAVYIGVTAIAKGTGTYLGARLVGRKDHWNALSFSAALNTRGAMDIIIATIGLSLGILSPDMFSIVVLMAMTASLAAPAALRWVLQRVQPSEEELARLKQEELTAGSLIGSMHRVLVPIRLRNANDPIHSVEAVLLDRLAARTPLAITLLTVTKKGERGAGVEFLDRISQMFPQRELVKKVFEGSSPSELILDESQKGYDLMVLGASQDSNWRVVFNPMVDYLVRNSPCATMVVKNPPTAPSHLALDRILVPTNGALPARRAAELGFALATDEHQAVTLVNVIDRETGYLDTDGSFFRRRLGSARQIVEDLAAVAESQGVKVEPEVRIGRDPEAVILDMARSEAIDVIILGTDIRPGSERLYLGPKVEKILNNAPCSVVVVNAT